ncbi:MAG: hypothetical protein V3T61_09580 [Acidobacteriota bacterium]
MGRKYGQQGYQEQDGNRGESRRSQPRTSREGPRAPRMPGFHKVVRCAMCGVQLPASFDEITHSSQCPKCGTALHSCKLCVYFDPASRFECSQPIPERIAPKDSRNSCEFFDARTTIEKITSSETQRPSDSRDAFEDLFKK